MRLGRVRYRRVRQVALGKAGKHKVWSGLVTQVGNRVVSFW